MTLFDATVSAKWNKFETDVPKDYISNTTTTN